ncbi:MAG: metal-sensitive transcriptional regulator [Anaerolineales bacterium]|nr:metal-sensitive transcriptional regulator [Anaerolineales bacterium]
MSAENKSESSEEVQALLGRLRRIEGQIRGLQRMLTEERSCSEIILQLMAVRKALDAVGVVLLNDHINRCLQTQGVSTVEDLEELRSALKLWAG